MKIDLSGHKALVCGASQGIGKATALLMAERGAQVTLLARSADRLDAILSELPGSGHKALVADLGETQKLKDALSAQATDYDILVCNTGGPKGGPIYKAEDEEFMAAFQQHVLANSALFKAVHPYMKKTGYGRVINVISTSVKAVIPNLGVSNTIRGAVANWSKTLSQEVASEGITVNNVLPGFTKTPRLEKLLSATSERLNQPLEKVTSDWQAKVPAGRFAEPDEVAEAIAFLASPAAAYINGVNLPVDGGRTPSL